MNSPLVGCQEILLFYSQSLHTLVHPTCPKLPLQLINDMLFVKVISKKNCLELLIGRNFLWSY